MHSLTHNHGKSEAEPAYGTAGLVMNMGWSYDLMVAVVDALLLRGKLRTLRQKAADLARLQPGEAVLDVGCGTGTLALIARERVGETGRVSGIDPGPQQIARARFKAARRGLSIDFQTGVIEHLAFPDQSLDVVLSTLMMHHLPDDLKRQGLAEIARVLKPGGRLAIADFKRPEKRHDRPAQFGAGEMGLQDLPDLIKGAGFSLVETGDLDFPNIMGMISGAGFALVRKS